MVCGDTLLLRDVSCMTSSVSALPCITIICIIFPETLAAPSSPPLLLVQGIVRVVCKGIQVQMWLTIDPGLRSHSSLHPCDLLHPRACLHSVSQLLLLSWVIFSCRIDHYFRKEVITPKKHIIIWLVMPSASPLHKARVSRALIVDWCSATLLFHLHKTGCCATPLCCSSCFPLLFLMCILLPSLYSTENEWQRAAHSETFAVMWVERNAWLRLGWCFPTASAIIAHCNVSLAFSPE